MRPFKKLSRRGCKALDKKRKLRCATTGDAPSPVEENIDLGTNYSSKHKKEGIVNTMTLTSNF